MFGDQCNVIREVEIFTDHVVQFTITTINIQLANTSGIISPVIQRAGFAYPLFVVNHQLRVIRVLGRFFS